MTSESRSAGEIVYNAKQQMAFQLFEDFLHNDEKIFGLFGYAGAGKTFIASKMIEIALERNWVDSVIVCTPTHKALDVIESYVKAVFQRNGKTFDLMRVSFMTVHKLLGLRPVIVRETGDLIFQTKGESKHFKQIERKLVIVDECSMINKNMYAEIDKYSHLYPVKIMFSGDPQQLPPVKEAESVVFKVLENVPKKIRSTSSICLDQIMRTASPTIMLVSLAIRTWDRENVSISDLVDQLVDIYQTQGSEKTFRLYHVGPRLTDTTWFRNMINRINNGSLPTITTWRNAIAERYNNQVRKFIHGGQDLSGYLPGDYVMFNNYYRCPDTQTFYTSAVVKIISVETVTRPLYDWSRAKILEVTSRQEKQYNAVLRQCSKIGDFEINILTVERSGGVSQAVVYTMTRPEIERYNETILHIRSLMENYYRMAHHDLLASRLWSLLQDHIIGGYADICFGYSLTTHKAQGSTFDYTIVDLVDILSNPNIREAHHALYTAVGRAAIELAVIVD
jgi:ABC-type dipeptide/oligopeptide/nickel transport system ATPase subunit